MDDEGRKDCDSEDENMAHFMESECEGHYTDGARVAYGTFSGSMSQTDYLMMFA